MLIANRRSLLTFYCPTCRLYYGQTAEELAAGKGVARCPYCKHHRTDGFNQREPYMVVCLACGARIGEWPGKTTHCPNAHLPDHG